MITLQVTSMVTVSINLMLASMVTLKVTLMETL